MREAQLRREALAVKADMDIRDVSAVLPREFQIVFRLMLQSNNFLELLSIQLISTGGRLHPRIQWDAKNDDEELEGEKGSIIRWKMSRSKRANAVTVCNAHQFLIY